MYNGIKTAVTSVCSTVVKKTHNLAKVARNLDTIQTWGRITVFTNINTINPVVTACTNPCAPLKNSPFSAGIFATPETDKDRIQYIIKIQTDVNKLLGSKAKRMVLSYYKIKKWIITGIFKKYTVEHEKKTNKRRQSSLQQTVAPVVRHGWHVRRTNPAYKKCRINIQNNPLSF